MYTVEALIITGMTVACVLISTALIVTFLLSRKRNSIYSGVYVPREDGTIKESKLAGHFCTMVISNIVLKQCLLESENQIAWMNIRNDMKKLDQDEIFSIDVIHEQLNTSDKCMCTCKTSCASKLLEEVKEEVYENLIACGIKTPPYFTVYNYIRWINLAMKKIEK